MARTFTCYLHKPGVLTPELRIVACPSEGELPDAILAELPTWGAVDLIEVYADDEPLFRISADGRPAH